MKVYIHFLSKNIKKLVIIVPGLIGGFLLIASGLLPNDDAFITFTHAKNFALYGKLVWNIFDTENTIGSSTPFFSLILGILGVIFGYENIPVISVYINSFFLFGTGVIVYKIVLKELNSNTLSFLISLLCCINSYNIKVYSHGFEFSLFTFLLFLNLYLFLYKDALNNIYLLLPNFLILTRIEGIVIYPLVIYKILIEFKNKKIKIYKFFIPFSLLFLYVIYAYFYYDQILPQSISSKKAWQELFPVYPLDKNFIENFNQRLFIVKEFWGSVLAPILRSGTEPATFISYKLDISKAGNFLLNSNDSLLNYFILISLVLLYFYYKTKRIIKIYLFIYIYFYFIFVFYTIRVESWYLPPLIISYLLFFSIGTYYFILIIIKIINYFINSRYLMNLSVYFTIYFTIVFILLFMEKNYYIINKKQYPFEEYRGIIYSPGYRDKVEIERYFAYKDAIHILNQNNISGEIASPEIGVLGFYYDKGNVLDLFGLCSKKVIQYYYEWKNSGENVSPTIYVLEKTKSKIYISGYNESNSDFNEYLKKYYNVFYIHPRYTIFGDPMYIWIRK